MTQIDVSPESMHRCAASVEEAGNQFGRDAVTLGGQVSDTGLYGGDELGRALLQMDQAACPDVLDYFRSTGELIEALSWLGMTWPEADEELLLQRGQHWLELGRAGGDQRDLANDAVATMLARNHSPGLERFSQTWERVGGGWGHLHGSMVTADAVAAAYFACAAAVLAMKLAVIASWSRWPS